MAERDRPIRGRPDTGNGSPGLGELSRNQKRIEQSLASIHEKLDQGLRVMADHESRLVLAQVTAENALTEANKAQAMIKSSSDDMIARMDDMRKVEITPLRERYEGLTAGTAKFLIGIMGSVVVAVALAVLSAHGII